jgi:hypothetical protein
MSAPEGADIEELVCRLGDAAVLTEAEVAGLGYDAREKRMRCPFEGCQHKGPEQSRSVQFYPGRHPRVFCFRCSARGDLLDLVQATRNLQRKDAIAYLSGQPAPAARPRLALVQPEPAPEDKDKLTPEKVKRLWDAMLKNDAEAEQYLEKRGLGEAVTLGLVRFAFARHPDKDVSAPARRGYRIAMLVVDTVGNPVGIQLRLVGEPKKKGTEREIKQWTVKGSSPSRGFFGQPHFVEGEPIVCVAEGMADTLAVAAWSKLPTVGAAGASNLSKLALQLEATGVSVENRLFFLFTQNDGPPKHESRKNFERLRQLLVKRGARAFHVSVPDPEIKDIAAWLQNHPDAEWPPEEVRARLEDIHSGEPAASTHYVQADGCALSIPARITTDRNAQDFTTLCALLDDPGTRELVMNGRGELSWCQMRHGVVHGGKLLADVDIHTVRLGLEAQGRSMDGGKALKFSIEDIEHALMLLAHKKSVHPAREWLKGLKWDGTPRLELELPGLFGQSEGSLAGTLLRRWFVAAAARAMSPGCKMDTVLVLVGPQAAGKTTFFEALGGEWYTSEPVDVGDKDGKLIMRRAWIVEWGELQSLNRARDQESIKDFLSRRVDQFRPHYGRRLFDAPRSCVIVGTTNSEGFLHDPTGNRRFWPVKCEKRIDVGWVRANREQLFAEAVAIYQAAQECPACKPLLPSERCAEHRWYLTDEEELELATEHKNYEATHPWSDIIEDWLGEQLILEPPVTAGRILIEVLKKHADQVTRADEMVVSGILKQLGWIRRRKDVNGRLRWVYERGGAM